MLDERPAVLPIPEPVLDIARRLEAAGFETWCVGGAVRDNLLGDQNADFDLATAARPVDVQGIFRRTVPIGVEHGTVAVLDEKNQPHEVTTFRRDVTTDGRHAVVEFGVSIDEDLARRDFTINAIAYHPTRREWRDPCGGMADLEAKLLRAVGEPQARFREDYLRILRLLRFAARFGFSIDPPTWQAARAAADGLARLSAERVREEWLRGLATARQPSELVRLWHEIGGLGRWLPEIGGDRLELRAALDGLPRDPVLHTAYLSADPAATLLRLRCSRAEVERGRRFAAHRETWPDTASPRSVRHWMASTGPAVDDLVVVAEAEGQPAALGAAVAAVRAAKVPLAVGDLAVDGRDLLAAGIPAGPAVGETLRRLLDRVLDEPDLNTREALLRLAAQPPPAAGAGPH